MASSAAMISPTHSSVYGTQMTARIATIATANGTTVRMEASCSRT